MIYLKSDEYIEKIADSFKKGAVGIVPTDTVYGFSAIADVGSGKEKINTDEKIRRIKGRAETKPFIELIAKPEDIYWYTDEKLPDSILNIWPGPLTVIVRNNDSYRASTGRDTTAFRCPGDLWLRKIIGKLNCPLYSTSVNRSGFPVLDEIQAIRSEFEGDVDFIVDDGDKKGAVPSTIVSLIDGELKIIRKGSVQSALIIPNKL